MSLPKYELSEDDGSYPVEKKTNEPPRYEEQIGLPENPSLIEREIIFCNMNLTNDLLSFTSEDAVTKYKSFSKVPRESDNFKHAINLQQQGIGMPLLEAQFNLAPSFGNGKFATIYKFVTPDPNSGRLFDKKVDKFKFCTVRKKPGPHHTRYTFTILPNQDNPSETFDICLFLHTKLPIADVTTYGGNRERYRWVHSKYYPIWLNYAYSLYRLDEGQPSMIDNMDVINKKLNKNNPLVYSSLGDFLKFPKRRVNENYLSLVKFGELNHLKNKYLISSFQETAKLLLHVEKATHLIDLESIKSVSNHELIIICMSFIFKRIEENRTDRRRSA